MFNFSYILLLLCDCSNVTPDSHSNTSNIAPVCLTHNETELKKITLVNCLIIVILIIVIAANINEGEQ